jgi:phosphatidylserine decarboxylase
LDLRTLTTMPGFPRLAMSRAMGAVARIPVLPGLRAPLWGFLARRLNIDRASIPGELKDYRTFLELFTRPLPEGARPMPQNRDWCSPSDGRLVASERISSEGSWVIKGTPYSTRELLPGVDRAELQGYRAMQVYLAPRDYHRYHAPCDLRVDAATVEPGGLQPVDPTLIRRSMRVLLKNRRILLHCTAADGTKLWLLYVGALNVGGMRFGFDDTLGARPWTAGTRRYDPAPTIARGAEMGCFEFGSTVVVFAPAAFRPLVRVGDSVLVRQGLLERDA